MSYLRVASPTRHQDVVIEIAVRLRLYERERGGKVLAAPTDVLLSDRDVVEPDVLYVAPDHLNRVEPPFVRGAPDLVIEVSSPSTRDLDVVRKRHLYERHGIAEYWLVDLDADAVLVHRLGQRGYGAPVVLRTVQVIESPLLPGFVAPIEDLLLIASP